MSGAPIPLPNQFGAGPGQASPATPTCCCCCCCCCLATVLGSSMVAAYSVDRSAITAGIDRRERLRAAVLAGLALPAGVALLAVLLTFPAWEVTGTMFVFFGLIAAGIWLGMIARANLAAGRTALSVWVRTGVHVVGTAILLWLELTAALLLLGDPQNMHAGPYFAAVVAFLGLLAGVLLLLAGTGRHKRL